MTPRVSAVIVSYNSNAHLDRCCSALFGQEADFPIDIVIVDCGSTDKSYLVPYRKNENCRVIDVSNIGYGAANNIGLSFVSPETDYVVILNPDTFLDTNFITSAITIAVKKSDCAVFTGTLFGYDISENCPTNYIDSTGIFRKWYGRWYDRGQGEKRDDFNLPAAGEIQAACGALLFIRLKSIEDKLPELFDESFFMYKEDIELSIRLRKKGWKIYYSPELTAYHCRGWGKKRRTTSRAQRLESSYNEIKIYLKHPSPYIVWAIVKYSMVKLFNI